MERQDARFKLENARIARVKHHDKVSFANVICMAGKFPSYFEVVAFTDERHGLKQGDPVTILGELQMRKPRDGEKDWKLQLVARELKPGDNQKAPRPRGEAETKTRARDINPGAQDFEGDDIPDF